VLLTTNYLLKRRAKALRRRALTEIARSFNVSHMTIARLAAQG